MSETPLCESTLCIKKIVNKKEATHDGKLSNTIIEGIQCLINASSINSKYALVNINITVASIEFNGKEGKNVAKTVSKKRQAIESEQVVNEEKTIDEQCSDSCDSTTDIVNKLVQLEELELPRNTPTKNSPVKKKKKIVSKTNNNSDQPEMIKNKSDGNEKVNNCELAEMDKQCLDQLQVALGQLLQKRHDIKSIINKKFRLLANKQNKKKKNKEAKTKNQPIGSSNNASNSVNTGGGVSQHTLNNCTGKPLKKKRKTGAA